MTNVPSKITPPFGHSSEYCYDLGSFGRTITTTSPEAQIWFNRGLTWAYGYNHDESATCFEQAISCDPTCAMAYWGLAFALGPNYNKPWNLFDKEELKIISERTYRASRDAEALAAKAAPFEQALIRAIQFRFQTDHEVSSEQYAEQNRAYARAMESVYRDFEDDLDVVTLYADALMNLTPWKLWDLPTGNPNPEARTIDVKRALEKVLNVKEAMQHPGILHSYIHLVEMSPSPELGLKAANHLHDLIPDSGHLRHMPSHLYILIGDYQRSIQANYDATIVDEKFMQNSGFLNFYSLYRLHNYHSLIYAAMFAGAKRIALRTVDQMEFSVPDRLLRVDSPPMVDWLESFRAVRLHVMIRFGMWEEILQMSLPIDQSLYCVTTTTIHYAKGVAWAATGNIQEADNERTLFHAAFKQVPSTRHSYPNKCEDILAVAAAMLDGEIEYRRGNFEQAFSCLRKSIQLDDALTYAEPWGWMQPARHAYAALLLEQDYVEEAAQVYRADLGLDRTLVRARQHPNNVWALQGYFECLTRLDRTIEASLIEQQLKIAIAGADVSVNSSCFCRTDMSRTPKVSPSCSMLADVRIARNIEI